MTTEQITTTTAALKAAGHSDAQVAIMIKILTASPTGGKQARECACGCGGWTKGGRYQPGHDAKHLSATLRAIRAAGGQA